MANLIESYRKVFENHKAHISLGIIAIIWTIVSTFWDIKTGNINNYRQNPFDILFNLLSLSLIMFFISLFNVSIKVSNFCSFTSYILIGFLSI